MKKMKVLKEKVDKRLRAFAALFAAASLPLSAQADLPGKMSTVSEQIMAIFKSTGVTVLLACFLCGSAIAYAFNKDNEKVKRNCIAVGVAAAILVLAQQFVEWITATAS